MAKRGKLKPPVVIDNDEPGRPVRFRRYKQLFLIVGEDEDTEPAYFRQFKNQIPAETIFLKEVGTGLDQQGVVLRAIEERNKLAIEARKEVDIVWVVFDKDDADLNATRIENFERAYVIANVEHINIALSNEAFELWLLLHLCEVDATVPLSRVEIYQRLGEEIRKYPGFEEYVYDHYSDAGTIVPVIAVIGDREMAITRAEKLNYIFANTEPIYSNPSTGVCELVKELIIWINYYSWEGDS